VKGGAGKPSGRGLFTASIGKQAREEDLNPDVQEEDNRKGGGKKDLFHGQELIDASKLSDNSWLKKDRLQPLPKIATACCIRTIG